MQKIQNIIFDLGGVLLNIDFNLSEKAFEQLGVENFKAFFNQFQSNELFIKLETGMDVDLFYDEFRSTTSTTLSNDQIKDAWNALLLNFRNESIKALPGLRNKYKLYVLSNTNEIHLQEFQKRFTIEMNLSSFDDLFDATYYSHRIGFRKPNANAFQFVLEKHQLIAEETLFIDDSINNIVTAQQLRLQTIHLLPQMKIEELGL
jgi:putative hydrolase of the HAD superfamily